MVAELREQHAQQRRAAMLARRTLPDSAPYVGVVLMICGLMQFATSPVIHSNLLFAEIIIAIWRHHHHQLDIYSLLLSCAGRYIEPANPLVIVPAQEMVDVALKARKRREKGIFAGSLGAEDELDMNSREHARPVYVLVQIVR